MFVQSHPVDCNHNKNRTGIFLATPESLVIYRPKPLTIGQKPDGIRSPGRQPHGNHHHHHQQQQQQQQQQHPADAELARFMREKTLLEQLRVRDARKGFVGSHGLENHRMKRMQSCLEPSRPHTLELKPPQSAPSATAEPPPADWQPPPAGRQRQTVTAAATAAADRARRAQLASHLVRSRTQLPLVDAVLDQLAPFRDPADLASLLPSPRPPRTAPLRRLFAQPPTVNVGGDVGVPRLPSVSAHPSHHHQQHQQRVFVPGTPSVAVWNSQQSQQHRLYRMRSGRERLRKLGLRGSTNGGDAAAQHLNPTSQPHINDIFCLPDAASAGAASGINSHNRGNRMDGGEGSEQEDFLDSAPPPTATQLRRRSGRRSQDGEAAGGHQDAPPPPPLPARPHPVNASAVRVASGGRRLSSIEMLVQNEDGEAEEVEIDVADVEEDSVAPLSSKEKSIEHVNDNSREPALPGPANSGPDQPTPEL